MKNILSKFIYSSATLIGLATSPTFAQNTNFAPGDLVLAFQKVGGTNTVYASLGNAATLFRGAAAGSADGVNRVKFLTIGTTLTSAFGSGWASDTSIYAGLAGVWGSSSTNAVTLQDGDPHRTLYISKARASVGTVGSPDSSQWDMTLAGNTAMTSAASGIITQNSVLETFYLNAVEVAPTSISQIDNQNPFISPGIQGAAMSQALEGGVQQVGTASSFGTFGAAGSVEFALDLYRVLAINTAPGQVAGDVRTGSYEGTVTVDAAGKVSFIAKGAEVLLPEIAVEQPTNSGLIDGTSKKSFGTVMVGKTGVAKTFTIRNTGNAKLTLPGIIKAGTNAADFIVTAPTKTSLAPNGFATFKVSFKPIATGVRNAIIRVKSNDSNENPFDIQLTGMAN